MNLSPRRAKRGVNLIYDVLPCGRQWYDGANAISNAIEYAEHFGRSHDAVIRVYDDAGNAITMHVLLKNQGLFPIDGLSAP